MKNTPGNDNWSEDHLLIKLHVTLEVTLPMAPRRHGLAFSGLADRPNSFTYARSKVLIYRAFFCNSISRILSYDAVALAR